MWSKSSSSQWQHERTFAMDVVLHGEHRPQGELLLVGARSDETSVFCFAERVSRHAQECAMSRSRNALQASI